MRGKLLSYVLLIFVLFSCSSTEESSTGFRQISGIYPHLAFYNNEGSECGVGALVPWADKLWAITYGASNPYGSSDKLYEISSDLNVIARPESNGGTHANRMIHRESKQLFMGYYAIDSLRNVRVIPYEEMPGRITGNARHLSDPEKKIYYGAMEGGFYEVDVNSLDVTLLYRDASLSYNHAPEAIKEMNQKRSDIPKGWDELLGDHGKGLYSGQGVLVYSNNGERAAGKPLDTDAGSLSEWSGGQWKLIRRNQFCEVTGPGGIYGNDNPETDPIWATGWDHKSLLVGVRDHTTGWSFYRLPKASHSYDGLHGHFTEWPRIRDIGSPEQSDYLMTMHGMFWRFPQNFTASNSAGIRPRSAYLKIIGDYTRWNDKIVFGTDDSPHREFDNKRLAKGNSQGPGQSNSNLWFTSINKPDELGSTTATGSVWMNEEIPAGQPSDPFLFAGWKTRCAWIQNEGKSKVDFTFEIDTNGKGDWTSYKTIPVEPGKTAFIDFKPGEEGEWIRVKTSSNSTATVTFSYTGINSVKNNNNDLFTGLSKVSDGQSIGGLLYGLGNDKRRLGIAVQTYQDMNDQETGYYELDENMTLEKKVDSETHAFIKKNFTLPAEVVKKAVQIEESSVLIIDDKGRRWRLPLGDNAFTDLTNNATMRICREVVTERDLFNCHGTFYELPAESADGYAKIRPVSSHNFRINDYASYRGLLVMTGINPHAKENDHIIRSKDGKAAVWAGAIDDLWELGKPVGKGGPWKNSKVKGGEPSDPYLIGFYDHRTLEISHDSPESISFNIEVDPTGNGSWMTYKNVIIPRGETFKHQFPAGFQARWIRFIPGKDCGATTLLEYN
ncbi:MAG: hypothetical protein H3C48_11355 [Chitinophagaceae bacterium]|nr:hypothetical protein [Chitinophagaceae bacterium]